MITTEPNPAQAGRTLLLDEKEVVHLPDGTALEPEQQWLTSALEERRPRRAGEEAARGASALEERHGSSGAAASTFTATRFASQSTGAWAWNISWQGGHLLAHKVAASNHSLTGGVQVGWLTLGGESALTRAEGLCSRPCASTSADATATVGGVELKVSVGGCQNTACQRMDLDDPADDSPLLFDPATLARLESACQTAGTKPPICSAEEQACICHVICHEASCSCMMSRTKAGLSAGNMCMHMHMHVHVQMHVHIVRPTHYTYARLLPLTLPSYAPGGQCGQPHLLRRGQQGACTGAGGVRLSRQRRLRRLPRGLRQGPLRWMVDGARGTHIYIGTMYLCIGT